MTIMKVTAVAPKAVSIAFQSDGVPMDPVGPLAWGSVWA
jgi:hypothetical protein